MKFTTSAILGLVAIVALTEKASAQNTTTPCAAQDVFTLCQSNQDTYIKGCQLEDFQCLCRWHKAKLSCWDNCPNDAGRHTQDGLVTTYCSMPGANVTSIWVPPSSTAPPVSQPTSSGNPTKPTDASNTPTQGSSASGLTFDHGLLGAAGAIAAYMLL
ncbi:uncharacterized protein BYT42DRAFT_563506 [Radiomyces spectabilis]|uniref:uncharacterized protein n=1 Tax=Radiomyces spectabilis TaxID=64574 RepID=UPI00221FCEB2|nr:uncharacterized protein BYT42DRAFT_563506 [Radiomyces spectabilis]KAI8384740.1 hypothetical protein BYT42DRAFT_563506 [Radiomyces spectabilis]